MRAGWSSIERGRRVLGSLLVIAVATSVVPLAAAAPAAAQDYMVGIDVSRHQGTIDWTKVAESGQLYVFQKATEGATITDPTYLRNRSGAASVSIPFGAYHFAYPQGGSIGAAQADAVSEANHFLAVAEPAAGDLIPVLDLEKNPDPQLPPRRLIAWTQAWLDTVAAAVEVKPLIYTNPNFWTTHLNDTTAFAEQGFPLWIAHYTSDPSPRLPASGWNGQGWAFWQWTSCGEVPGITGCVDMNRYEGSDLSPYTIPGAPAPEPTPEPATPPANETPPEISGQAEVGRTLSASSGTWSGSQPQAYSYAWFRCSDGGSCDAVLNGTAPTYELKPGDYGHRMQVTVTATNSAGSAEATSAPSEVVADTTPPDAPEMTKPARANLLSTTIRVAWSSVEPNATYDVRYRKAADGEIFGDHTPLVAGSTETKHRLPAEVGASYCFSARTVDSAGNSSGWSSEFCTVVALDDRDLRRSRGWVDRFGRAFYLDTFTKTKRRGSRLVARGVRTQEINLVAQRCPSCGRVAVKFNGERVGTVRLKAARVRNKRVIRAADLGSVRTGKVVIVVLSRGAPVKIDGLSLFRGTPASAQ